MVSNHILQNTLGVITYACPRQSRMVPKSSYILYQSLLVGEGGVIAGLLHESESARMHRRARLGRGLGRAR